jgi:FixJ family two-component response regulator
MAPPKVYVLDPDPQERLWIESTLAPAASARNSMADASELLAHRPQPGDACLITFADRDGAAALELVRELRRAGSSLPAIVLGPHSAFRTAVDIARLEATDFLERPVSERELRAAVRRACRVTR